ncbi:hypothetical protein [Flavobacterium lindanitolerans]|uniref:hypothetical protein n=1 Tax=Flavobacterium lindanitolerans TaxID=428988 RepID=UPI0023F24AA5|nr:hypothetical protein [Flavobacterium lindanitolerans]
MKGKNQTPVSKVSSKKKPEIDYDNQKPAEEHLESGHSKGISPSSKETSKDIKTTKEAQEKREKNLERGHDSLDIPSGSEGKAKRKK